MAATPVAYWRRILSDRNFRTELTYEFINIRQQYTTNPVAVLAELSDKFHVSLATEDTDPELLAATTDTTAGASSASFSLQGFTSTSKVTVANLSTKTCYGSSSRILRDHSFPLDRDGRETVSSTTEGSSRDDSFPSVSTGIALATTPSAAGLPSRRYKYTRRRVLQFVWLRWSLERLVGRGEVSSDVMATINWTSAFQEQTTSPPTSTPLGLASTTNEALLRDVEISTLLRQIFHTLWDADTGTVSFRTYATLCTSLHQMLLPMSKDDPRRLRQVGEDDARWDVPKNLSGVLLHGQGTLPPEMVSSLLLHYARIWCTSSAITEEMVGFFQAVLNRLRVDVAVSRGQTPLSGIPMVSGTNTATGTGTGTAAEGALTARRRKSVTSVASKSTVATAAAAAAAAAAPWNQSFNYSRRRQSSKLTLERSRRASSSSGTGTTTTGFEAFQVTAVAAGLPHRKSFVGGLGESAGGATELITRKSSLSCFTRSDLTAKFEPEEDPEAKARTFLHRLTHPPSRRATLVGASGRQGETELEGFLATLRPPQIPNAEPAVQAAASEFTQFLQEMVLFGALSPLTKQQRRRSLTTPPKRRLPRAVSTSTITSAPTPPAPQPPQHKHQQSSPLAGSPMLSPFTASPRSPTGFSDVDVVIPSTKKTVKQPTPNEKPTPNHVRVPPPPSKQSNVRPATPVSQTVHGCSPTSRSRFEKGKSGHLYSWLVPTLPEFITASPEDCPGSTTTSPTVVSDTALQFRTLEEILNLHPIGRNVGVKKPPKVKPKPPLFSEPHPPVTPSTSEVDRINTVTVVAPYAMPHIPVFRPPSMNLTKFYNGKS